MADAIYALARELRLLSFGGASITENGKGAIEDLSFSVNDSGRAIAASISSVAESMGDIAAAIRDLTETIDQSRKP